MGNRRATIRIPGPPRGLVLLCCSLAFCALRLLKPEAGNIQFHDDAVVNQAIDGCGRGHRVLEDLLLFAERQVAGQHHATALVAFGQECEEHLHLFAALLNVTQIINDQRFELGQSLEHARQPQIALSDQELLHKQTASGEQDRSSALSELLSQCTKTVTLPGARLPE